MKRVGRKNSYTTGDVAKLCGVSIEVVARWERQGMIHGFRVGKGDRRFSHESAVDFLRRHGVPYADLRLRTLAYGVPEDMQEALAQSADVDDEIAVNFATDVRGLWFELASFAPHAVVIGEGLSRREATFVTHQVRTLSDSTVLAFGAYAADAEFDECIPADATPQLIAERLQVATKQQQERLDAVRKFTRRRRKDDDT